MPKKDMVSEYLYQEFWDIKIACKAFPKLVCGVTDASGFGVIMPALTLIQRTSLH
jgi:hypothetical protein